MKHKKSKRNWRKPGANMDSVLLREDAYSKARRAYVGDDPLHRSGIALSGGGIRAACFSLGVLSWLERSDQLKNFDYISSVSGGGYAAASVLGSTPANLSDPTAPTRADLIRDRLKQEEGYLKPTMSKIFVILILAVISSILALSPILLLFGQATPLFTSTSHTMFDRYGGGFLSIIFIMIAYIEDWRKPGGNARLFTFLAIVFGAVQASYFTKISTQDFRYVCMLGLAMVWCIIFYILSRLPGHPIVAKIQYSARYAVAFLLLLSLAVVLQVVTANFNSIAVAKLNVYLYFSALLLLGATCASPNKFNVLFKIYHEGLRDTFGGGKDDVLYEKEANGLDPIHLINCFLQSSNSNDSKIRERGGENFCVSKFYTGANSIAYFRTKHWHRGQREARDWSHQTVWRLIATSGAALDTHPTRQSPIRNAILSALNCGLGAWVINPSYRFSQRKWWPSYFLNFILALNQQTSRAKWIRLSDGGHFENLGVYELIARKCMNIVIVDAGHDPNNSFSDLAIAAQRCWEDFRAEIDITNLPLKGGEIDSHVMWTGTVQYPNVPTVGKITYVKLGVAPCHSLRLRLKPSIDKRFPHEPTKNQFSTCDFVDSYFDLGYESAKAAVFESGKSSGV